MPQRRSFEHVVLAFEILPRDVARLYAKALPVVEIVIGLTMLSGILLVPSTVFASTVLVSFIIAISVAFARGRRRLDCGCLGSATSSTSWWKVIARNIALLIATLAVCAEAATRGIVSASIMHQVWLLALLVVIGCAGVLSMVALLLSLVSAAKVAFGGELDPASASKTGI